jgi:hypothetical protein
MNEHDYCAEDAVAAGTDRRPRLIPKREDTVTDDPQPTLWIPPGPRAVPDPTAADPAPTKKRILLGLAVILALGTACGTASEPATTVSPMPRATIQPTTATTMSSNEFTRLNPSMPMTTTTRPRLTGKTLADSLRKNGYYVEDDRDYEAEDLKRRVRRLEEQARWQDIDR